MKLSAVHYAERGTADRITTKIGEETAQIQGLETYDLFPFTTRTRYSLNTAIGRTGRLTQYPSGDKADPDTAPTFE